MSAVCEAMTDQHKYGAPFTQTYLIRRQLGRTELIEGFKSNEFHGHKVGVSVDHARKSRVPQVLSIRRLVVRGQVGPDFTSSIPSGHGKLDLVGGFRSDTLDGKDLGTRSVRELELGLVEDLSKFADFKRSKILRHVGAGAAATAAVSSSIRESAPSSA